MIFADTVTVKMQLDAVRGPQGERGPAGPIGPSGDQGPKGEPGNDGISISHEWAGTILKIHSASGSSSADLRGPRGDKGAQGIPGKEGPRGMTGESAYAGALRMGMTNLSESQWYQEYVAKRDEAIRNIEEFGDDEILVIQKAAQEQIAIVNKASEPALKAKESAENAAKDAQESANASAASASEAAASVANGGYVFFAIGEDGHLQMTKSEKVETLDFQLTEGRLEVIYG